MYLTILKGMVVSMTESLISVYSDCDGVLSPLNYYVYPRNWFNKHLPTKRGAREFLSGLEEEGVVEVAAVTTQRPGIYPFTAMTNRTVRKVGLNNIVESGEIVHIGSTSSKAEFHMRESTDRTIGTLDDWSHFAGKAILKKFMMAENNPTETGVEHKIVIGAVSHDRTQKHVNDLYGWAKRELEPGQIDGFEYKADDDQINMGYKFEVGNKVLEVVRLAEYSEDAGQSFRQHLKSTNLVY